ncbi:hypothetical protein VNO77_27399 [Canavalia gladiata]|uniref:Uncharacterized protein n=1 Tax=Canavalia gladiata TaxID=3824 RepID=A0AAN9Q6F3_CANGL
MNMLKRVASGNGSSQRRMTKIFDLDRDFGSNIEEWSNGVVIGVVEYDLAEKGRLVITIGIAVKGVMVEGVIGGFDEIVAGEDEGGSEVQVERV